MREKNKIINNEYVINLNYITGSFRPGIPSDNLHFPLTLPKFGIELNCKTRLVATRYSVYLYIPKEYKKYDEIPLYKFQRESNLVLVTSARYEEILEDSSFFERKVKIFSEKIISDLLREAHEEEIQFHRVKK